MVSKKSITVLVSLILFSILLAACASSSSEFPTGKFYVTGSERTEGFEFNRNGTFSFFSGSDTVMEGTYEVQGDVYTEISNNVENSEAACQRPSTYNWAYDGSTLRFTVIDDSCPQRRDAYTGYLFVK